MLKKHYYYCMVPLGHQMLLMVPVTMARYGAGGRARMCTIIIEIIIIIIALHDDDDDDEYENCLQLIIRDNTLK